MSRLAIGDRVKHAAGDTGVVRELGPYRPPYSTVVVDGALVAWDTAGDPTRVPVAHLTRKRGRPPSTEATGRCVSLSIRLHPLERAGLEAAAKAAGLSVADYVRSRLVTP